jgi:hypothetical protein
VLVNQATKRRTSSILEQKITPRSVPVRVPMTPMLAPVIKKMRMITPWVAPMVRRIPIF